MKHEDKILAESVLKYLCIGRRICGIDFCAMPILVIDSTEGKWSRPWAALTIESGWSIFNGLPETWPSLDFPKEEMNQERI